MYKKLLISLLAATFFVTACESSGGSQNTNNASPTPQPIIDKLIEAEKLAANGQPQEAVAMAMPYTQYGDGSAELSIGYIHNEYLKDKINAINWYKKSAAKGNVIAKSNLGYIYYDMYDYDRAYDYFEDSAEKGDLPAITQLGVMHYNGESVERDYRKAVQYFQQAQQQGDARAHYFLGICYLESHGIAQDLAKAKELLTYAENHGIEEARKKLRQLGW